MRECIYCAEDALEGQSTRIAELEAECEELEIQNRELRDENEQLKRQVGEQYEQIRFQQRQLHAHWIATKEDRGPNDDVTAWIADAKAKLFDLHGHLESTIQLGNMAISERDELQTFLIQIDNALEIDSPDSMRDEIERIIDEWDSHDVRHKTS